MCISLLARIGRCLSAFAGKQPSATSYWCLLLLLPQLAGWHPAYGQTSPPTNTQNAGPKFLIGTGSSVAVQRGSIDVDRLSKLTEAKLEQVRTRVLRNTATTFFNNNKRVWEETSPLKNFTCYNYTYQLLESLTSGKSKATLTKQMSGYLVEYAYVYAFARYLKASKFSKDGFTDISATQLNTPQVENFVTSILPANDKDARKYVKNIPNSKAQEFSATTSPQQLHKQQEYVQTQSKRLKDVPKQSGVPVIDSDKIILADTVAPRNDRTFCFNFTLDYAYAVILAYQKKHPGQNKFLLARGLNDAAFLSWYKESNLYAYYKNGSRYSQEALDVAVYNRNKGTISRFPDPIPDADDPALLLPTDSQSEAALEKFMSLAADAQVVVSYISQVEKSRQLESIKPEQFKAMKALLREFAERFRSLSTNNVVAGVAEVLIENLQREPISPSDPEGAGYFYLDAESAIATLYEQYTQLGTRRLARYVGLVGNIGFNYLHFINSPTLLDDNNNTLRDIYLASEKLGFKYKAVNWRYTHSAQAGQTYRYYGNPNTPLYQQKQPLLSDLHVALTSSGILYNIINTKTDKAFNYGLVQGSIGVTLFNNLCFDASLGTTFTNKSFGSNNMFFALSIDIPLLDYILAGRKQ